MLTRYNKGVLNEDISQKEEVKEIAKLIKDLPKGYKKILLSTLNELLTATDLSTYDARNLEK